MNATVARIVEIMFQETEMNEEVMALKDEIMNNCQERYNDMIARGMSEDEAISVVVESLKGMEEVIEEYPRKKTQEEPISQAENGEEDLRFHPDEVKEVQANLISEDIALGISEDEWIHVRYNGREIPLLCVVCKDGVLSIEHTEGERKHFTHVEVKGNSFTFDGDKPLMENLRDLFKSMPFVNISINVGCGKICLDVPRGKLLDYHIHTTSGDVSVQDFEAENLNITTVSGDVSVQCQDKRCAQAQVKTSSGDVEMEMDCTKACINTMSGDVTMTDSSEELVIRTVSGDVHVDDACNGLDVKTVSGDMHLNVDPSTQGSMIVASTSGDAVVRLPENLRGQVAAHFSTISGDKHCRHGEAGDDARLIVYASSISGDLSIR